MPTVVTAESCTGGNIAHCISSQPGCSSFFIGSVVAYSNDIKINVLHVSSSLIKQFGAVSKEVAEAMAIGVRDLMESDYSISTTGVAGPSGGTIENPVGTVWIAVASRNKVISQRFEFSHDRAGNIYAATRAAFDLMEKSFGLRVPYSNSCFCSKNEN